MTLDLVDANIDAACALDWERTEDAAVLAVINEQAYGLPAGELAQVLTALSADSVQFYIAREDGTAAACVATVDESSDCGISAATRPASRQRGLAGSLMCQALIDARRRGCTSNSLQSSNAAVAVYERLGYRDVCAIQTWEQELPARPRPCY